jgi:hypothetical protein
MFVLHSKAHAAQDRREIPRYWNRVSPFWTRSEPASVAAPATARSDARYRSSQ